MPMGTMTTTAAAAVACLLLVLGGWGGLGPKAALCQPSIQSTLDRVVFNKQMTDDRMSALEV